MPWSGSLVLAFLFLLDQSPGMVHLSTAAAPRPPSKKVETGLVILSASVDQTGIPACVEVVQGASPFIGPALEAVRQWTFDTNKVKAPSTVTIAMLFRARTALPDRPFVFDMPCEPSSTDSPPTPSTIVDPGYPIQSIAEGSVILQMQIDSSGIVQKTDVIRGVPSLTLSAIHAVSQWRFLPSRRNGKAVPGNAVAVISFLSPVLTH
jgi:outer membrane biosynthesis protein TonB